MPKLNTIIDCILPTHVPLLAALFCTENVVENFSHVHQLVQLLTGLSRSLKEQEVCVCVWDKWAKKLKRTVARSYQ